MIRIANSEVSSKPSLRANAEAPRYKKGQSVRLRNAYLSTGNIYLITASLPPSGDMPQYRIRNETEKFERMALEVDLEAVSTPSADKDAAARSDVFDARA